MTNEEAREDFMNDVYNTLDFLPTNNEANRIIDSFDRVTSGLEQQPCEDAISRKDMLAIFRQSNSLSQAWNGFENLPPVTPKSKSEYEHDHEVVKAYNDGQAYILDKIRAEIKKESEIKTLQLHWGEAMGLNKAIDIIDKYRGDTDVFDK